jgi:hypothetical protein
MSGYDTVLKIRRLEEKIDTFGFRWGHSKHGSWGEHSYGNVVALFPKDDCLPIFSRDTELFVGSIEQLEIWLSGLEWARNYDSILIGNTANRQRERKEQDYRNKQLLNKIKESTKEKETV